MNRSQEFSLHLPSSGHVPAAFPGTLARSWPGCGTSWTQTSDRGCQHQKLQALHHRQGPDVQFCEGSPALGRRRVTNSTLHWPASHGSQRHSRPVHRAWSWKIHYLWHEMGLLKLKERIYLSHRDQAQLSGTHMTTARPLGLADLSLARTWGPKGRARGTSASQRHTELEPPQQQEGPALWHRVQLPSTPAPTPPSNTGEPAAVHAAAFSIYLPGHAPGKATAGGPWAWASATQWDTQMECRAPGFSMGQPSQVQPLGSEPADEDHTPAPPALCCPSISIHQC